MNIMPGAESFAFSCSSDTGVLLLHGFSGSPFEMRYFGEGLFKAGYNVECPRLSGHGTRWEDLNRVRYSDWIRDAEFALKNLKTRSRKIYLAGLSMGGALALELAERHPEIRGVILINHAMMLKGFAPRFLFLLRFFKPYKMKRNQKGNRRNVQDRTVELVNYDRLPMGGAYQMQRLSGRVRRRLKKVRQPLLIMKSRADSQPVKNVFIVTNKASSKRKDIVWLENSFHVATVDVEKNLVVNKAVDFIRSVGGE